MGLLDFLKPKAETRSISNSGYTAMILGAREAYLSGVSGIAELTSTVQSCVTLWESVLTSADVSGTDLLDRHSMAVAARGLALRGEAVFLIRDTGLVPAVDWEISTRDGKPKAYRINIAEAGGGTTVTALAAETLHFRIGADAGAPWAGTAPLHRARLSAGLLQEVETALSEVYRDAPIGSSIVPFPEAPDVDLDNIARGFRGRRGRVLLRESVNVTSAGGMAPNTDWRANDLSPDIRGVEPVQSLQAARGAVMSVFGVLPAMLNPSVTGPVIREGQRHLVVYALQPIAMLMAEEASKKLGTTVTLDCARPTQAFDTGGRARALGAIIGALAQAKELGIDPENALRLVNWEDTANDH